MFPLASHNTHDKTNCLFERIKHTQELILESDRAKLFPLADTDDPAMCVVCCAACSVFVVGTCRSVPPRPEDILPEEMPLASSCACVVRVVRAVSLVCAVLVRCYVCAPCRLGYALRWIGSL